MRKFMLSALLCSAVTVLLQAQTARVQIIHNSPTPTVDIYAGATRLVDDFAFGTATPFIDVPAGSTIPIGVALGNSTSSAQALATFPTRFEAGRTYVVIATGIVGGTPAFELKVFDMGLERTANPANVGILFFHGSPDAPTVDVVSGGQPIINDVSYGQFQGILQVPANNNYRLSVTPGNNNSSVVATYEINPAFWQGRTLVIVASGFLGGNREPGFAPFVALSNGGTFPLTRVDVPTPPVRTTARLQVIHNSPTPTVDIYANGTLLLDNFAFRTATPFIDVPAGTISVAVAPGNSTSVDQALATFPLTLVANRTYVAIATGIVGGTPGFDIRVFDQGRERSANPNNVDLLFFHGSTDAPTVDVINAGSPVINDVSYGQFQGYLSLPANPTYRLGVTPGNDNRTIVASYDANLSFWRGRSAVIVASGFLTGNRQPGFVPFVALSNGGTFPLPVASGFSPDGNVEERSELTIMGTGIAPNPTTGYFAVQVDFEAETGVQANIINAMGQVVHTKVFGELPKGAQMLEFDASNLSNGKYFLSLRSTTGVQTLPLVIAH
jgi:Domain of unknown function (DUF4397)/Secretion system C-terminal sorting domain